MCMFVSHVLPLYSETFSFTDLHFLSVFVLFVCYLLNIKLSCFGLCLGPLSMREGPQIIFLALWV